MNKKALILLLLVGILCVAFPVQAQDEVNQDGNFTTKIVCGIDGFVAYDNPVLVKVTVESKRDFNGTLSVIPEMSSGQKVVAYGEDITLAAGQAKTFSFIPAALGSNGDIQIMLLDDKGKKVYSHKEEITLSSLGVNVMVGILSDDYTALNYLEGVPLALSNYQNTTSILELTKESLPADSGALSILNYIVIDNFDTATLSDEQYLALKEWVNKGGVLILSLGGNYQNVLHRFQDDFITGSLGTVKKKNIKWESPLSLPSESMMQNWEEDLETQKEDLENQEEDFENIEDTESTEQSGDYVSGEELSALEWQIPGVDCIDFTLDGESELLGFSSDGTARQKKIGNGSIVVLSYALGMEPIASYGYRDFMIQVLFQETATTATQNKLTTGSYEQFRTVDRGIDLAGLADNARKPSVILYGLILMFYVILIGPVLYLVLKAVNKREKLWTAIPLVALAFTGIIYMTGFLYRINKPLVHTFSLITLSDTMKTENLYTNITCPKAKQYTIGVDEAFSEFFYNVDDYSYSLFSSNTDNGSFDYMIKEKGNEKEFILNNAETFVETGFMLKQTGENDIGMLDYDLKCYTTGFEGTVTNNTDYDLSDVVITFQNYYYMLGDMKKGEQVTIDSSKIQPTAYDLFYNIYNGGGRLYSDRDLYRKYRINDTVQEYFIDTTAYNQGYIWGTIHSYTPDFIENGDVKQAGNGVILQTYNAEYADIGDGIYYPSIEPMIVSVDGNYDTSDGSLYDGMVEIRYSFVDYPGVTTLEKVEGGEAYKDYADVYAYNAETGAYDRIFADSDILSGSELKKYLVNGMLSLRYMPPNDMYCYIPKIVARGDE